MKKLLLFLLIVASPTIRGMEESQTTQSVPNQLVIRLDEGKELLAALSAEDQSTMVKFFDEFSFEPGEMSLSELGNKLFGQFPSNLNKQLEFIKKEAREEGRNTLLDQLKTTQDGEITDAELKDAYETFLKKAIDIEKQLPGSFTLFKNIYAIHEEGLLAHLAEGKKFSPAVVGFIAQLEAPLKEKFQAAIWSEIAAGINDLEKVSQNARDRVSNLHKSIVKAVENGQVGSHLETHVKNLKEKFIKENSEEKKEGIKAIATSKNTRSFLGGMTFMGLLWAAKTLLGK